MDQFQKSDRQHYKSLRQQKTRSRRSSRDNKSAERRQLLEQSRREAKYLETSRRRVMGKSYEDNEDESLYEKTKKQERRSHSTPNVPRALREHDAGSLRDEEAATRPKESSCPAPRSPDGRTEPFPRAITGHVYLEEAEAARLRYQRLGRDRSNRIEDINNQMDRTTAEINDMMKTYEDGKRAARDRERQEQHALRTRNQSYPRDPLTQSQDRFHYAGFKKDKRNRHR